MNSAPAVMERPRQSSTRSHREPAPKWEPVYRAPCLAIFAPAKIKEAIERLEQTRRGWAINDLAEACAEYLYDQLERRRQAALPRRDGYTEEEWADIMRAVRQDCAARTRKNRQEFLAEVERLQFFQAQYRQQKQLDLVRDVFDTVPWRALNPMRFPADIGVRICP